MNKVSALLSSKKINSARLSVAKQIGGKQDTTRRYTRRSTCGAKGQGAQVKAEMAPSEAIEFETGMAVARGVLVVEEAISFLKTPLQSMNFIVFSTQSARTDAGLAALLTQRVMVTDNAEEFRERAAIYEFSIIDIARAKQNREQIAQQISVDWSRLRLKSKHSYILRLASDGESILEAVE